MGSKGRGRGESKNVEKIDEADERVERDRRQQLEAARLMGIPESEVPIRGRGGFRQAELRTIPENISEVRAKNPAAFQQCDILCNYVPINPMQGRIVHSYRIDFEPKIESVTLMRRLFNTAAGQAFTAKPIYDGVHECRSSQDLAEKVTNIAVTLPDQDSEKQSYKITFTNTGTTQWGPEILRLYNTQMKDFLRKMGYYSPQPGLFVHPNQVKQVGDEIMMLRGYATASNLHEDSKMLMNFNAAHKLVQKKNVLEIMSEIRNRARSNVQEAIKAELTGKLVVTAYDHKAYRVEDIDFSSNPTSTFQKRTGEVVSFADYYKSAHNLTVRERNQPLLVVVPNNTRGRGADEGGDRPEIKLIPELCNIAGLTDAQRNDGRLKRDLITASQINPNDRVEHLRQFLAEFHKNNDIKSSLQAWGYSYGAEPIKIRGHTLPPTAIGSGPVASQKAPIEWPKTNPTTADFNVTGLASAPTISKMVILIPRLQGQFNKEEVINKLKQGFQRINLRPAGVDVREMDGDLPTHYINHIRNLPADVTITIIVMNRQNKERYDAIKKAASCECGKITQVVTAQLLCDPRKSGGAATKIAIQIAAKVGGEPWWVDIPTNFGAMVCGYDTYHDTAKRGRSFGAFVASMNNRYSRWFSKADAHDKLDEMSTQVSANMREALIQYHKLNQKYPDRVIIYRDGVGEGQVEHIVRVELKQIQEALKSVEPKIKSTIIIVNKRVGARFYMRSQQGFINPPPGTVIDHAVTRQERYDFYLISQSTRQGTITPTYYNIIHDEIGLPPDIYQKMAYKFCLLYYNWSGSVRVPAPCQYAHKLALLCGEHLHNQPNAIFNDRLHFL